MKNTKFKSVCEATLCGVAVLVLSSCNGGGNAISLPTSIQNTLHEVRSNTITVPVSDLEAIYEGAFCQLNSQHNVTLSSNECQTDIAFIGSQSATGNFNLNNKPITNNQLGVTGVSFESITYTTDVSLPDGNRTFLVSGGLIMPEGISKSAIKGVVVYFNGTTFDKSMVGSNFNSPETQLVASVFASQGYIVAIPDYIGQGSDWQDVHPYVLYPKVSAKTAIDMLTAVEATIKEQYGFNDTDVLKLFSVGFSEGGAYSLWFNSYLTDNQNILDKFYKLTHSVGMEGAYDVSNVTKGFLFDNVALNNGNVYNIQNQTLTNSAKPVLSAEAFLSYAFYSQGADYNAVFNPKFFAMDCLFQGNCNIGGSHLNMAEAFALPGTNIAQQVLNSALGKSANGLSYPTNIISATSNSIRPLMDPALFGSTPLDQTLEAANVNLSNLAESAVSIITLKQDSVVSPNNFSALFAGYQPKIKSAIEIDPNNIMVVSSSSYITKFSAPKYIPVDHLQAPAYEDLYALNILNQF